MEHAFCIAIDKWWFSRCVGIDSDPVRTKKSSSSKANRERLVSRCSVCKRVIWLSRHCPVSRWRSVLPPGAQRPTKQHKQALRSIDSSSRQLQCRCSRRRISGRSSSSSRSDRQHSTTWRADARLGTSSAPAEIIRWGPCTCPGDRWQLSETNRTDGLRLDGTTRRATDPAFE